MLSSFTAYLQQAWSSASGVSDVAGSLAAFFATVTDYRMWRSLGWILLGLWLTWLGLLGFLARIG